MELQHPASQPCSASSGYTDGPKQDCRNKMLTRIRIRPDFHVELMLTGLAPVTSYKPITQFTGNHWQRPAAILRGHLNNELKLEETTVALYTQQLSHPSYSSLQRSLRIFFTIGRRYTKIRVETRMTLPAQITADWDLPNITTIPSFDTCSTGPSHH